MTTAAATHCQLTAVRLSNAFCSPGTSWRTSNAPDEESDQLQQPLGQVAARIAQCVPRPSLRFAQGVPRPSLRFAQSVPRPPPDILLTLPGHRTNIPLGERGLANVRRRLGDVDAPVRRC